MHPLGFIPIIGENEGFRKIRKVGEGGEGVIWLVERRRDRALLARKTYSKYNEYNGMPSEVYIMYEAIPLHPRILTLESWEIRPDLRLDIYFPYCRGGDLGQFIPEHGRGLPEEFVWHVFIQVADALALLRKQFAFVLEMFFKAFGGPIFWILAVSVIMGDLLPERRANLDPADYGYDRRRADPHHPPYGWQPVVHRDIKPYNVFCRTHCSPTTNSIPDLVLGDFGIASTNLRTSTGAGTPTWQGPEYPVVTAKTDVWGLGAIVHTLCHGTPPVDKRAPRGISEEEWSMMPESKRPMPLLRRYSDELNRNMMDCLRRDPRVRINSRDLIRRLIRDREKLRVGW